ncbi:MAG: zinc ribbon domain-containing protein [Planctomycetaceae bacterium]|nr:zinc ribbon domain-containing protein [Planctomycetaceae bacterium]
MPIFEYRCETCQSIVEIFLRSKEERPVCPACQGKNLEKLMSAPAGHVSSASSSLPITGGCPPMDAPPCHPQCCRLPR